MNINSWSKNRQNQSLDNKTGSMHAETSKNVRGGGTVCSVFTAVDQVLVKTPRKTCKKFDQIYVVKTERANLVTMDVWYGQQLLRKSEIHNTFTEEDPVMYRVKICEMESKA